MGIVVFPNLGLLFSEIVWWNVWHGAWQETGAYRVFSVIQSSSVLGERHAALLAVFFGV